jgi:hypothetical protein
MDKASDLLGYFVIEMEPQDLYSMICGNDTDMLAAFAHAASYMKPSSYHGVVDMPVLMSDSTSITQVPFVVRMESCQRYPSYLMPLHTLTITPESKWYHKIEPSIKLAQEWQITKSLFKTFAAGLTSDQLAHVLPWVKELAKDGLAGVTSDTSWRFKSEHSMGWLTNSKEKALIAAFTRLGNPNRASRTPALTSRINQATRLGNKLFAQYRLLKGKGLPKLSDTYFVVNPSDELLPAWYARDIQDIIDEWTNSGE